jgi:diacylglycerol kinase (ATP)
MASIYKNIHVIINPASGGNEPILNTLNDVFTKHGVRWDASITHQAGDATKQCKEAVQRGADMVAGYGGDGTQMEVVAGLRGSGTPLGILPGGTGNAMAFELGIPRGLRAATELLCTSSNTTEIDLAQTGERIFMLRAYTGPKPEYVASREEKDRLGIMAYPLATLRVLKNLKPTKYRITIDGETGETEGLACFVFNAGASGGIDASLPEVSASDGVLDLYMLHTTPPTATELVSHLFGRHEEHVNHWRGRKITIETDDPEDLWLDGEPSGQTPCTIQVLPREVRVVTL